MLLMPYGGSRYTYKHNKQHIAFLMNFTTVLFIFVSLNPINKTLFFHLNFDFILFLFPSLI